MREQVIDEGNELVYRASVERLLRVPPQPLDPSRVTFHLIPLPKGVKGTRGAGFLGHEPSGTYAKSTNKTFLCTAGGSIPLNIPDTPAALGPEPVFAQTLWTGKKGAARAMAWTVRGDAAIGCALPFSGFAS